MSANTNFHHSSESSFVPIVSLLKEEASGISPSLRNSFVFSCTDKTDTYKYREHSSCISEKSCHQVADILTGKKQTDIVSEDEFQSMKSFAQPLVGEPNMVRSSPFLDTISVAHKKKLHYQRESMYQQQKLKEQDEKLCQNSIDKQEPFAQCDKKYAVKSCDTLQLPLQAGSGYFSNLPLHHEQEGNAPLLSDVNKCDKYESVSDGHKKELIKESNLSVNSGNSNLLGSEMFSAYTFHSLLYPEITFPGGSNDGLKETTNHLEATTEPLFSVDNLIPQNQDLCGSLPSSDLQQNTAHREYIDQATHYEEDGLGGHFCQDFSNRNAKLLDQSGSDFLNLNKPTEPKHFTDISGHIVAKPSASNDAVFESLVPKSNEFDQNFLPFAPSAEHFGTFCHFPYRYSNYNAARNLILPFFGSGESSLPDHRADNFENLPVNASLFDAISESLSKPTTKNLSSVNVESPEKLPLNLHSQDPNFSKHSKFECGSVSEGTLTNENPHETGSSQDMSTFHDMDPLTSRAAHDLLPRVEDLNACVNLTAPSISVHHDVSANKPPISVPYPSPNLSYQTHSYSNDIPIFPSSFPSFHASSNNDESVSSGLPLYPNFPTLGFAPPDVTSSHMCGAGVKPLSGHSYFSQQYTNSPSPASLPINLTSDATCSTTTNHSVAAPVPVSSAFLSFRQDIPQFGSLSHENVRPNSTISRNFSNPVCSPATSPHHSGTSLLPGSQDNSVSQVVKHFSSGLLPFDDGKFFSSDLNVSPQGEQKEKSGSGGYFYSDGNLTQSVASTSHKAYFDAESNLRDKKDANNSIFTSAGAKFDTNRFSQQHSSLIPSYSDDDNISKDTVHYEGKVMRNIAFDQNDCNNQVGNAIENLTGTQREVKKVDCKPKTTLTCKSFEEVVAKSLFRCRECDKQFKTMKHLTKHKNFVHSGQQQAVECNICKNSFSDYSSLREHRIKTCCRRRHVCRDCNKSFGSSSSLAEHRRIHTDQRPYTCQSCQRSFRHLKSYKSHLLVHTGERPFSCRACGLRFTQRANLDRHSKRHVFNSEAKPEFKCCLCSSVLRDKEGLARHMKIPHLTCCYCDKGFCNSRKRDSHIAEAHKENRPFKCELCPSTFSVKLNLTKHMSSVHRDHDLVCDECGAKFKRTDRFNAHKKIHNVKVANEPNTCRLCAANFNHRNTLSKHYRAIHNVNLRKDAVPACANVESVEPEQLCLGPAQQNDEDSIDALEPITT